MCTSLWWLTIVPDRGMSSLPFVSQINGSHVRGDRYTWLEENCPRVYACARETLKHPILKKIFLSQDFEARLTEA